MNRSAEKDKHGSITGIDEHIGYMIELLKSMQNPLQDYADIVGAPAFAHGYKYVYPEPEDYAIETAIVALEEMRRNHWIPVTEQLPEERMDCLVTVKYSGHMGMSGKWIKTGHLESDGEWWGDCIGGTVIAWRPLPESYCEEGD